MKNAIKRLIERFHPPREKESAMVKLFDAHSAYLKDPSFENHVEVYKAHLSSKEAE